LAFAVGSKINGLKDSGILAYITASKAIALRGDCKELTGSLSTPYFGHVINGS